MDALFFLLPETEAGEEPLRGIEALHVDGEREAGARALLHEAAEQEGAEAGTAMLGQHGDIEDVDVLGGALQVEAAHVASLVLDDGMLGLGILGAVVVELGTS